MRYDYFSHQVLNESIRQISSREHAISIMESIIHDIFSRTNELLESEDFFIEFYADNKSKLNSFLTENVITEEQFINHLIPFIAEGIWSRIMGDKLQDYDARLQAVSDLAGASKKYRKTKPELYQKGQEWKQKQYDIIKQKYLDDVKNQGGIRGFANRLKNRLTGGDENAFKIKQSVVDYGASSRRTKERAKQVKTNIIDRIHSKLAKSEDAFTQESGGEDGPKAKAFTQADKYLRDKAPNLRKRKYHRGTLKKEYAPTEEDLKAARKLLNQRKRQRNNNADSEIK